MVVRKHTGEIVTVDFHFSSGNDREGIRSSWVL